MKQKDIRNLVKAGAAIDITTASNETLEAIKKEESYLTTVGASMGVCGRNGQLLRGHNTGTLYAITARTTNIFWHR